MVMAESRIDEFFNGYWSMDLKGRMFLWRYHMYKESCLASRDLPGMQFIVVRLKLNGVRDLPRFEAHRGHRFSGTADDSLTTPRSRDISSDHAEVSGDQF
jgi:hypothetical protein